MNYKRLTFISGAFFTMLVLDLINNLLFGPTGVSFFEMLVSSFIVAWIYDK
jgi:hypothetical protein